MPGITSIEQAFPRPAVVGVVNVTPDSFSDGGDTWDQRIAIARGLEQLTAGAAIVDIGGESTRPGADPVAPEEELHRVIFVVEELVRLGATISIDTRNAVGRAGGGDGGRVARQRRLRAASRPAHGGGGRRLGRRALPHAHARGRSADDAGRPALHRRGRRRRELPRGQARRRGRRRRARGAHLPRSGHRLRQDARAQPPAPARAPAASRGSAARCSWASRASRSSAA